MFGKELSEQSVVLTWTSFSPKAIRLTISDLEALSGFGFVSYSASRIAWSPGLKNVYQLMFSVRYPPSSYLVRRRFCRTAG